MDDGIVFERAAYSALNKLFSYHIDKAVRLIEAAGSARNVFRMPEYPWRLVEAELEELESLGRIGCRYVCLADPDYPQRLREIPNPPLGLYIREAEPGSIDLTGDMVAIVGSRNMTPYGREWCTRICSALATSDSRPTIVSGLALGVDINAHNTALEKSAPTIGIMGSGIDIIYPSSNLAIAKKMLRTKGCGLVCEYPPGSPPLAKHFLSRNRIIAGLANKLVLIESRLKGGAMVSANYAISYKRQLYALPGRIDDPLSAGCNYLIANGLASSIINERQVYTALKAAGRKRGANLINRVRAFYEGKMEKETVKALTLIISLIEARSGISIEDICAEARMEYKIASGMTSILEGDSFIRIDLLQRCSIVLKDY